MGRRGGLLFGQHTLLTSETSGIVDKSLNKRVAGGASNSGNVPNSEGCCELLLRI